MLKRDMFIGIVIFMLFAIGLIMTLENIKEKKIIGDDDPINNVVN